MPSKVNIAKVTSSKDAKESSSKGNAGKETGSKGNAGKETGSKGAREQIG